MFKRKIKVFCLPTLIGLGSALMFSSIAVASDEQGDECYQFFSAENYHSAKQQCQEQAELGDAKAAFLLANIYYQGLETKQDDQRGLFWDQRAAEKGHPDSAYRLGLAYQLGQGVNQSNGKARSWYQQAALAQHPKAQMLLANMFESGIAGEKSASRAYQWYMRAAQQGLADAQLKVGSMLLDGRGIEENQASAQHWIRKAANAGNANAQVILGVLLAVIDPAESLSWYERSAEQGNGVALQNLALVYYVGQGVEVDHLRAVKLAQKAVDVGNKDAAALLSLMKLETSQQKNVELQAEKQELSKQVIESIPEKSTDELPLQLASLSNDTTLAEPAAGYAEAEPQVSSMEKLGEESKAELKNTESETVPNIESNVESVAEFSTGSDNPYRLEDGWVMHQSSSNFTLQLLYGTDESGMLKYINQHQLPENVRYFRTLRSGEVYYVLVYGNFETLEAAKAALMDIPETARTSHWIRQFSQLKEVYLSPIG